MSLEEFHKLAAESGQKAELGGMLYRGQLIWKADEPVLPAGEYTRRRLLIDRKLEFEESEKRAQELLKQLDNL